MSSSTSNIEAVAREHLLKAIVHHGASGVELAADVDRYWHCYAAQLDAGQIDETGNKITPFDFDKSLKAYRDWCQRHPESRTAWVSWAASYSST